MTMSYSFLSVSLLLVCLASIAPSPTDAFSTSISRREAILTSTTAAAPFILLSDAANAASDLTNFIDGPRGLKYQVVTPPQNPDSAPPERAQKVKALYTLWTGSFGEDGGSKVDSSKGIFGEKPFEFYAGVSAVIKGWDLAILDMRAGEKRRLVVPSDLGYGDKGAGGKIPGGATLYFDVELVEVGAKLKTTPDQEQWLLDNPV